jgi:hypothetical protein
MKKRSLLLVFAAPILAGTAVLGGVGSANAGQVTQTFTNPTQSTPFSVTFYASQFDLAGSDLTSVAINVTSDITGVVQVINISPAAQTFSNATSSVPVMLTGPGGLSLNVTATTSGQSGTIAAATPPGYTSETLPGNTVTASVGTTLYSPNLAPYIGSGVADLALTFSTGSGTFAGSSSANGSVFFGGTATADATVTLVYNYTTVPEPASVLLLGIGMAGFLVVRRFSNRMG